MVTEDGLSKSFENALDEATTDKVEQPSVSTRRKGDNDMMKYKRKLRNRESAARSRRRQQIAIESLRKMVIDLSENSAGILDRCQSCALENAQLKEENTKLFCQNTSLRLKLFMVMVTKAAPQLQKLSTMAFSGFPRLESGECRQ
eukprot:Plantae.Rhodophyta-Purpureofilum_apyrenoidigerum.ctg83388.p1 GENE.Plantae.Rhodophyta-Purpureofilum_apyrenoidigerum.ctg83388~~Plantae.Rhodophyta-Purpureofilum_apyrenoidigerum.ctg83388.p1  ORF type:complete len:152 (+),score=35.80 Plantae.Rhodophyta-Purpureofilum_apyrenoidigerum.ctg83388:24-458(+)